MTETILSGQDAALQTLSMLETRLRRLEFLIDGTTSLTPAEALTPHDGDKKTTISARMSSVEEDLRRLEAKSPLVERILKLCQFDAHWACPISPILRLLTGNKCSFAASLAIPPC